ncbi:MAG: substrate-binding domain-containing protein, partial [Verrucomicrobiota bacterium]
MKRIITLLVAATLCGCGQQKPPAPNGEKPIVIGVTLLNLSNEFIVTLNQAMAAKAKELGVKLIVNDAQRSADRQNQQVESFIAQKVDAIILNPCEVEASSPAVEN